MAAIKTFHNSNLFVRRGLQQTSIARMNAFMERRCRFLDLPKVVIDHMRIVRLSADRRSYETSKRFQCVMRIDGTSTLQTIQLTPEQVYWDRYTLFDELNLQLKWFTRTYIEKVNAQLKAQKEVHNEYFYTDSKTQS
jgi:hypothetical protein